MLSEEDVANVEKKIAEIMNYVDIEPKTKKWKKRAKDGEKKKWWRDVEERIR